MFDKVFISYAREDFDIAEKIYEYLTGNDLKPWMDKKNLLTGQDWDLHIQTELRNADYVVILFSENSVSKRGYVQKEFKAVLKYLEEKLDTDIYILPVKLDGCTIPLHFGKYQYLDYNAPDSLRSLLSSIHIQQVKLIQEDQKKKYSKVGLDFTTHKNEGVYGTKAPKQLYEIDYFLFNDSKNESLKELNTLIQSDVLDYLFHARNNFFGYLGVEAERDKDDDDAYITDSTLNGLISFSLATPNFISYSNWWSVYDTGAAHGSYWNVGRNYLLNPLRKVDFYSLFDGSEEELTKLISIVHPKIMEQVNEQEPDTTAEEFYIMGNGLEPKKENFENFIFRENKLVFIYNPYHLGAWVYGSQHPEITFEELRKTFPENEKLNNLLTLIAK